MLPLSVLKEAQRDLLCYPDAGCSVMEMSHRSRPFEEIIKHAEKSLRTLMNISNDYSVLFLQGGASLQFSMIPMNLAAQKDPIDYIVTGQFAKKAYEEGCKWGSARAVASSEDKTFSYIPDITPEQLSPNAKYLHITVNNTIFGTAFNTLPQTNGIPLVGDLSSVITGKHYDVNSFDLIYAGAQKNMGPSGLTVVIVRNSLLQRAIDPIVPTMLSYKVMADSQSMYNTPPCFAIYIAGLVFDWVLEMGGVLEMEKRNIEKSSLLYDAIDAFELFSGTARRQDRSIMNVTFTLPNEELTKDFGKLIEANNLINLKGHRSVGGFRASIYNAMPIEGVQKLVDCMKDFESKHKFQKIRRADKE
jgi:phosphoserine aminotransferase